MKKYWVMLGAQIFTIGTTMNLSAGDKIFVKGTEITVVEKVYTQKISI